MKYKVGDKVERIGTVSDAGTFMMKVSWDNGDYSVFIGDEDVSPVKPHIEPVPVVWRDGAVEWPDGERDWFYIEKDKSDCGNSWIAYTHIGCFGMKLDEIFWIYADDFPMPEIPELTIETCPYCHSMARAKPSGANPTMATDRYYVTCTCCSYRSEWQTSEQQAIDKHNELCRKLKSIT